jgi:hypothetical protein
MMSASELSDKAVVTALLQVAGLEPDEREKGRLVAGYRATRSMMERLYSMPGVRYEEPAITMDPRVNP